MSKLGAMSLVNQILMRVGESTVSALTALTGIQLKAFEALNEVIHDLAIDYQWQPLESLGTFTLVTDTATYSPAADIHSIDPESFRCPDNDDNIDYFTAQEWDEEYPEGIGTDTTGYPTKILKYGAYFYTNKYPSTAENTKIIHYRYWQIPTLLATAAPTGTCWIPEGFDYTLLVNYATYLVLHYKNNPEAGIYYNKVFGTPAQKGQLDKMKDLYGSPILKPRVSYIF